MNEWRHCSTCKRPIAFGSEYYRCNVSTCNRKRTGLYFCSVACWDAHVPEARHRDAWAEQVTAPTEREWEAEREREAKQAVARAEAHEAAKTAANRPTREDRAMSDPTEIPKDILVVVSKLKKYVRARSGMNTSDAVVDVLSERLRRLCDQAIDSARRDGRKTVLDRDFSGVD